jgi:hypothetical protein
MTERSNEEVIAAMERFGGSFIQQFARLYRSADLVNRGRLQDAFPDYWTSYQEMAAMDRRPPPEARETTR